MDTRNLRRWASKHQFDSQLPAFVPLMARQTSHFAVDPGAIGRDMTENKSRWSAKLAALDANLLVALDALLQEGNVTRAAARLGITQSATSQTLGRLRDHFDDPILVRVGRQMQPTPFAQRIRARLHAAIGELQAVVHDRPAFEPASASRRFVLATVDYLAMLLVAPMQRELAKRAPGVDLAIHALDANSVANELEAGVVDLYVGVRGATERGMSTEPLFQERLMVVVRDEHPLLTNGLTAEGYADFPHLHVSPRREGGTLVGRTMQASGLTRRVAVEVPYFTLVPQLLRGSDLVATVPGRLARHFAEEHGVVALEPPIELPLVEICMAWDPRFEREPGIEWLREFVKRLSTTL